MPPKKKTPAAAANANGNGNGNATTRQTRKRVASADVDDDPSQQTQTKKKAKAAPKKTKTAEDDEPKAKVEDVAAAGKSNIATSKDLNIPLDEMCPNSNFKVYIDDNATIFDANLNQTNSSANNNKFYRLQACNLHTYCNGG